MPRTFREELQARETELRRHIERLQAELRDVMTARQALGVEPEPETITAEIPAAAAPAPVAEVRTPTIKEMASAVLQGRWDGATVHEIVDLIESRFGATVHRSSLSPQLTRLTRDGVVMLRNGRWFRAVEQDMFGAATEEARHDGSQ